MALPVRSHTDKLTRRERWNRQIHLKITETEWKVLDAYCQEHGIQSKAELTRTALETQVGKQFFRPRTACGHGRSREYRRRMEEANRP